MKNKIVIIGSYGCGNAGDNAILSGIINSLGYQINEFTVFCDDEQYISRRFNVKTVHHIVSQGISMKAFRNIFKTMYNGTKEIHKCDMLIIGGGSIIHDLKFYNLPYYFIFHSLARFFHKKVICYGVTVGPINTVLGKFLCRMFLKTTSMVCVRDNYSRVLLNNIGLNNVLTSADNAFKANFDYHLEWFNELSSQYSMENKKYVVLSICGWFKSTNFWNRDKIDFSNEVNFFAKIVDFIIDTYKLKVVFVPTVYPFDLDAGNKIEEIVCNKEQFEVINRELDYAEISKIIDGCYFLLGMRLHSLIFACRNNIPFYTIVYDRKVEAFLEMANMTEYSSVLDDLDFDKVIQGIDNLIRNYKILGDKLVQVSAGFTETIDETSKLVKDMLNYEE